MQEIKQYFADILTLAIAFVSPITGVFVAMFCFVLFDLITGVMKARKIARDKAIQQNKSKEEQVQAQRNATRSRKMSHSMAKFIFYFAGILLAHIVNHFMELEMPLVKMILGFIILIELKSIDENMKVVLGYSIFGKLLDIIKRKELDDDKEEEDE